MKGGEKNGYAAVVKNGFETSPPYYLADVGRINAYDTCVTWKHTLHSLNWTDELIQFTC
jgi:hypothetical protein